MGSEIDMERKQPGGPRSSASARWRLLLAEGVVVSGLILAGACAEVDGLDPCQMDCIDSPTNTELLDCNYIRSTATWLLLEGVWQVRGHVWVDPGRPGTLGLDFDGEPLLLGGELVYFSFESGVLFFRLQPDPGTQVVDVSLPLTCNRRALEFRIRFDVSGEPRQGHEVLVVPLD